MKIIKEDLDKVTIMRESQIIKNYINQEEKDTEGELAKQREPPKKKTPLEKKTLNEDMNRNVSQSQKKMIVVPNEK